MSVALAPARPLLGAARRGARAVWRKRVVAVPLALAAAVTASASSGTTVIQVHPGDTLSAIALRYHTTVARLVAVNHLPGNGDLIYAGQSLKVPGGGGGSGGHRPATAYHTVVPGDTLYGIAAHYHVGAMRIAHRNHLPSTLTVVLGQRLAIPGQAVRHRSHRSHHTSTVSPASAAALRDRARLARRSEPSQTEMGAIIRATAQRWGVDPSLALAIAWQESGWNMRAVSPVDAIGAMQVMPYTGSYVSTDLAHRTLDLFDAHDNATAGVALLSVLTHVASSPRQAVAGYYQGLQSVRDNGMLPSTKQYVANVMALRQRF